MFLIQHLCSIAEAYEKWRRQGKKVGGSKVTVKFDDVTYGKRKTKSFFFVLTLATAEQVGTPQLFDLNRSNLNLLLPDVSLMAHTVFLFKMIEEIRQ